MARCNAEHGKSVCAREREHLGHHSTMTGDLTWPNDGPEEWLGQGRPLAMLSAPRVVVDPADFDVPPLKIPPLTNMTFDRTIQRMINFDFAEDPGTPSPRLHAVSRGVELPHWSTEGLAESLRSTTMSVADRMNLLDAVVDAARSVAGVREVCVLVTNSHGQSSFTTLGVDVHPDLEADATRILREVATSIQVLPSRPMGAIFCVVRTYGPDMSDPRLTEEHDR